MIIQVLFDQGLEVIMQSNKSVVEKHRLEFALILKSGFTIEQQKNTELVVSTNLVRAP